MEVAQKRYDVKKKSLEQAMSLEDQELNKETPSRSILLKHLSAVERSQERYLTAADNLNDIKQRNGDDVDTLTALEIEQNNFFSDSEVLIIGIKTILKTKPQVHRLPKLELPKFGGEPREWLQFWNAFQTIHQDDSILPTVKFQYLVNCMASGSMALELVSSYPASAENYKKVINSLEERFGREEMLVEVYVRDLISLILDNAKNRSTNDFTMLYVTLSSQLRALGSLGVTSAKCAAILYPMMESTLPEEILVAWERYRHQSTTNGGKSSEDYLDKLMDFLKQEVDGSERIRLARQPFSTTNDKGKNTQKPGIPTAASLVVSEGKLDSTCVFCDGKHPSDKCCRAVSMSLEERRRLVKEKNCCFACLKIGHGIKKCKERIKCVSCGKRHLALLCPEIEDRQKPRKTDDSQVKLPLSVEMCNKLQSKNVFQTVLLRIQGNKQSKVVRAMFDNGSQSSYVLNSTASEVGLQKTGKTEVIHLLFGGVESKPQIHNCYRIYLESLTSQFSSNFEIQDSPFICGNIPAVPAGTWREELTSKGIFITDMENSSAEIEVLLGTDVFGKLLTGRKIELDAGPVALETKLGWTVSGKLFQDFMHFKPRREVSYHIQELNLKDLWSLDVIGITDPMKDKSKLELQEAALAHFKNTVTRNSDGRYVVSMD